MSKAKIIIEYKGKRYRCNTKTSCHTKRNCDLFRRGVCDADDVGYDKHLPCDNICEAFISIGGGCPKFCYKEVKAK